jgi:hypothetical protein
MKNALALLVLMFPQMLIAAQEEAAQAPAEPVSMVFVVTFLVLFFGMIGGFFVYLWWNEKNGKPE